ncbi:hypothetical protein, partial [Tenacibaculum ovolyticum]
MKNIDNIITKEFAWHYRIIPEKKSEEEIVFFIDEVKEKNIIVNELQIFFEKTIKLVPISSSE